MGDFWSNYWHVAVGTFAVCTTRGHCSRVFKNRNMGLTAQWFRELGTTSQNGLCESAPPRTQRGSPCRLRLSSWTPQETRVWHFCPWQTCPFYLVMALPYLLFWWGSTILAQVPPYRPSSYWDQSLGACGDSPFSYSHLFSSYRISWNLQDAKCRKGARS